jgi:hypothetical protein
MAAGVRPPPRRKAKKKLSETAELRRGLGNVRERSVKPMGNREAPAVVCRKNMGMSQAEAWKNPRARVKRPVRLK